MHWVKCNWMKNSSAVETVNKHEDNQTRVIQQFKILGLLASEQTNDDSNKVRSYNVVDEHGAEDEGSEMRLDVEVEPRGLFHRQLDIHSPMSPTNFSTVTTALWSTVILTYN